MERKNEEGRIKKDRKTEDRELRVVVARPLETELKTHPDKTDNGQHSLSGHIRESRMSAGRGGESIVHPLDDSPQSPLSLKGNQWRNPAERNASLVSPVSVGENAGKT
jgi:hypothetical protein